MGDFDQGEDEFSALDAAPEAPKPKAQAVSVRKTKRGAVKVEFPQDALEVPKETPADPEAEIQSMVEVESARPSLPKAIRGKLSIKREAVNYPVCEDQVTEAITGWCGTVPDAPGFQDEILKLWGGGRYVYTGIDKAGKSKSDYLDLGGYSKPIPNTPSSGAGFGGYPGNPEFQESYDGVRSYLSHQEYPRPGDPYLNDEGEYVAEPPSEESLGWVWVHARNHWVWKGPGRPPGKPPAMPYGGAGGGMGVYNPSAFYQDDDRVARLEKLVANLAEEKKSSPMDGFLAMMQAQVEERRIQLQEDRLRWEQQKEEREAERKMQAHHALEATKANAEAQKEVAKDQAEASKEVARLQADAMKSNSTSAVEAAKEMAKLQQTASDNLIRVLTSKQEEGGFEKIFDRSMQIAEVMSGGRERNAAEEISTAIRTVVPTLAESVRDTVYAVRGFPTPPSGAAGQHAVRGFPTPPSGAAGQQGTVQLQQQPQQLQQQMTPEQVTQASYVQLVGYLVNAVRAGDKPNVPTLAHGAMAYNLHHPPEKFNDVKAVLVQTTPEMVVQMVDQTTRQMGNPPHFVEFTKLARETCFSAQGRAWLKELQANIVASIEKEKAQLAAQQPTGQIAQAPSPAPEQPPAPKT